MIDQVSEVGLVWVRAKAFPPNPVNIVFSEEKLIKIMKKELI